MLKFNFVILIFLMLFSCNKSEKKNLSKMQVENQFLNKPKFKIKDNINFKDIDVNFLDSSNSISYTFKKPVLVNDAFFVDLINLSNISNFRISFFDDNNIQKTFDLQPINTKSTKFIFSLSNFELKSIKFTNIKAENIFQLGIDKDFLGFKNDYDKAISNTDIYLKYDDKSYKFLIRRSLDENFNINISYFLNGYKDFRKAYDDKYSIIFSNEQDEKTFDFYPISNLQGDINFSYTDIGFIPSKIEIEALSSHFLINQLNISQNKKLVKKDLGLILNSKSKSKYDVYFWSIVPNVLIFDFLTYNIQAKFFKRLAFFVEKKGYIGQLLSNDELASKHGWNAHDYSSKSLAEFFTKASKENFRLNKEEYDLLDILLKNNILKENDKEYTPQNGAIVGFSRQSSLFLRREFISHEIMHGIYFVDKEFRNVVKSCFLSLPNEKIKAIKRYFSWYSYNPKDEDLMINEYQAYSLQQRYNQISVFENKVESRLSSLGEDVPENLFENECAYKFNVFLYKKYGIFGDGVYQVLSK